MDLGRWIQQHSTTEENLYSSLSYILLFIGWVGLILGWIFFLLDVDFPPSPSSEAAGVPGWSCCGLRFIA